MEIVSQKIREQPQLVRKPRVKQTPKQPKPPTLTEFEKRVVVIAPNFKTLSGERYDNVKIIESLLGKPKENISSDEYSLHQYRVDKALRKLKKMGRIKQSKRLVASRLRTATNAEIEKHRKLVYFVLNRGHRFLRGDWRHHLTYDDAVKIGQVGLINAIERFDQGKGKFGNYATGQIAGIISDEVTRLQRRTKLERSASRLDAKVYGDRMERHEYVSAPETSETLHGGIKVLYGLHEQGQLKSLDLTIIALRLYGHKRREIGNYYGVTREAIRKIENRGKQAIKEQLGK